MKHLTLFVLCFMLVVSGYAETETPELEPIVVTATRDESLIENYPGSVQVITRQDIERTPAKDISELLKIVAGVEVHKRSEQDFVVDIRGFNNGAGNGARIILLINGMPAKNGDGTLDWSLVDLNDIEKIEIVRGNIANMYGDGAIAGVINIITANKPLKSYSLLKLTYGSYDKFGVFSGIKGRLQNGFYNIKANYEKSKGYRKNNEYDKKNINLTISHFLNSNTEIEGNINYVDAEYIYPGALTREQIEQFSEQWSTGPDIQNYNIFLFNGKLKHLYSPDTHLNLWIGYKYRKYNYPLWGTSYTNSVYGIEVQGIKKFNIKSLNEKITGGADFKKEEMFALGTKMESEISGAYLKNDLIVYKKVILSAGYRFDLIENIYNSSLKTNKKIYRLDNAKIGILLKFIKNNEFYLSWSKSMRIPTRDEIFNLMTGDLYLLKPEKAHNYEFGFRSFPVNYLNLNANVYYMKVEDEILGTGSWTIPNTNFKEITHQGIESQLKIIPYKIVNLNLSYTYQKIYFSEGRYKNKILPLSPENIFSAGISVSPINGLVISHISRWRDRCYVANDLENNQEKLKSYWVSDLKLMYKTIKAKIEFNIYNLYDERYSEFASISSWTGKIGYYPSSRRNYELSATLYF